MSPVATADMHNTYDIVIVGAGPCGLLLSTLLVRWNYRVLHIDNRPTRTQAGRADGIQPRSLELLKNLGLKNAIMQNKPARVFEVAFWDDMSSANGAIGGLKRTGTHPSCPEFIDTRYPWTTLLHQGLIEKAFLDDMESNGNTVLRPWTISDFKLVDDTKDMNTYPLQVNIRHVDDDLQRTVRTKFLFGAEGARSFVRAKLGIKLIYKDPTEFVWAVMDGVVKTDFPDIKLKCTIRSTHGSVMVIPRENNMVRLYIQLPSTPLDGASEHRAAAREVPPEQIKATAKRIFAPYSIDWKTVDWFSVYPIGQGVAERYSGMEDRVFIGGDACHTHSPKAGQGMNTAFLDALNIAWKLHLVYTRFSPPSILSTYESERRAVAQQLLKFDKKWAALFSCKCLHVGDVSPSHINSNTKAKDFASNEIREEKDDDTSSITSDDSDDFLETFKRACEFTSGYGVAYKENIFNRFASPSSPSDIDITSNAGTTNTNITSRLKIGRVLPTATLTRVTDANRVPLEQQIPLNGNFRLYIFTGRSSSSSTPTYISKLASLSTSLQATPFYNKKRKSFSTAVIIPLARSDIEISDVPDLFSEERDSIYADDVRDYQWSPDAPLQAAVHSKYGIELEEGAVVVARPDGYVCCVVSLGGVEGAVNELGKYFGGFMM